MVKWTPKSVDDLEKILLHVAENFSLELAKRTTEEIIDYTEQTLSANPLAGAILESNPLFSILLFKGNSIFYCENPKNRNLYIVYVQPRGTEFTEPRLTDSEIS